MYLFAGPRLPYQPWDSLAYSWECEQHLMAPAWANHPLGHVAGCAMYDALVRVSPPLRAFTVLATMNGIAGAAAVTILFLLLTGAARLSIGRAIAWTTIFAASYGFWFYAGTADLYGLSALTLVAALAAMIALRVSGAAARIALAGVLIALAAFAHQFNAVLLAAFAIGMWIERRPLRLVRGAWLAGSLAVVLTMASYAALAHVGAGSWTPGAMLHWLIGYGHDPAYGRFFGWHGAMLAIRSIAQTLLGQQPRGWLVGVQVVSVAIVMCLAGFGARDRGDGLQQALVTAALAACVVGVPLIVWWDPEMYGKWWLLVEPIAVLGLATSRPRALVAPSLAALVIVVFNGLLAIPGVTRADAVFDAGLARWTAETTADDVLVENGRLTPFLLFWANRPNTINLYRIMQLSPSTDRFALMRDAFDDARAKGHRVFVVRDLDSFYSDERLAVLNVTRAQVQSFLEHAATTPAFAFVQWRGQPELHVFR